MRSGGNGLSSRGNKKKIAESLHGTLPPLSAVKNKFLNSKFYKWNKAFLNEKDQTNLTLFAEVFFALILGHIFSLELILIIAVVKYALLFHIWLARHGQEYDFIDLTPPWEKEPQVNRNG